MERQFWSQRLFPMFGGTEYLAKIAKQAIDAAHIKPDEEVLIVADSAGSKRFLDIFMGIAHAMDIPAQLLITPFNPQARSKYDFYAYSPPKAIINAMIGADVIFSATMTPLVNWYSPYRSRIMETSRILSVKAVEDFLLRVAGPEIDLDKLVKRSQGLYDRFSKANIVKAVSPNGTDVIIKGIRHSAALISKGEVFKAGDEGGFPPGNYYVGFEQKSVNGTIVFDGAMKMLGVLKEPIKLTVKDDEIIKVEGGKQAKQLAQYIKDLNDPNFPYIIHFGFGVNPGAINSWNSTDYESVNGTIIWGVGRQSFYFEKESSIYSKEKGNISKNHFDCTNLNATVWIDEELLLKDGEWVPEELR